MDIGNHFGHFGGPDLLQNPTRISLEGESVDFLFLSGPVAHLQLFDRRSSDSFGSKEPCQLAALSSPLVGLGSIGVTANMQAFQCHKGD